jgi:glycosyltransferase involved in cell wall biosynthesis
MKICFVIHGLSMGGAEKFLINIANYFSKIGIQNNILLLSDNSELSYEIKDEIKIYKLIRNSRYDLGIFKKIKSHIKEHSYTTIFCINTYAFFFVRMAIFLDTKTPIIISPHTTKPFSFYKYVQNLFYCRLIRKQDKIIYLCKNQQEYLKKIYHYTTDNDDIIYNGINENYFSSGIYSKSERIIRKNSIGIDETEKIIVQVARISKEKKHINSLKALSIIHNRYKIKPHLIIVGSGDKQIIEMLYKKVETLNLKQYVHFVGNQEDVRPFYYISDLFTLTSESETFPISVLEALSFGLPCVLTNVGGVEEIIVSEKFGRIAKEGNPNSIAKEWNNALKSDFDSEHIRNYLISNFSAEKMFEKYRRIIDEIDFAKNRTK